MSSLIEIPATSFIVALSGALAPGPLMVTTIRESFYSRSVKPGLLLTLGHALAETPVTIILTYGLLSIGEDFFPVLSLLGGAVLVVMGFLSFFKKSHGFEKLDNPTQPRRLLTLIFLGVAISVSNPYWITWWLTIGAVYVSKALAWGSLGIALFYFSHEMGDLVVLSLVSKATAKGTQSMGEKGFKILIMVCNVAIIVIGIYFIVEGALSLK